MTENEAIKRCQRGDRDAFRYLVERYQGVVFGTAWNMTGDRAAAEELAQEAFLSAWKGIRTFRQGRPFKPWLMRILVNAVMTRRRRRHVVTTPIDGNDWPGDAEDPAASLESRLERQTLREAIASLSPEHRQVVALRYFAEMSVQEVARAAGLNEGTVKSRLHRAHRALRQQLTGDAQSVGGGQR